jgi:hypothetical protein
MRLLLAVALISAPALAQQKPDAPKRVATLLTAEVADFNLDGLSRTDLMKLKFQIGESRPGIVSPLIMLGVGGLLDFLGFSALVGASIGYGARYGVWTSWNTDPLGTTAVNPSGLSYATWTVGSVLLVLGSLLIACGGVRLDRYLPLRRAAGFKMDLIDEELSKPSTPDATPPPVP